MDDEPAPDPSVRRGFLSPPPAAVPADRCMRCGAPTAAGVALCAEHNPGRVRGPSSTQMHATVLLGVLAGVVGFLIVMRLAAGPDDPFAVRLLGAGADPTGGVALAFSIVNEAAVARVADCRVTRDGVPRPDDLAFRTRHLTPGELALVEKVVPETPAASVPYDLQRLSVICT